MVPDLTMHVTFIILCVFNLCFGFAWKGDFINHINNQKHDMESNESPNLSSYPYWRRKKVPDNIKHLSFMINSRKLKRVVYPKRFFQYSPYFIKSKFHENQKVSSPVVKDVINSKKHLETNSLNDLRHISEKELMNKVMENNLPPSIAHFSNPNTNNFEYGETSDESMFDDNLESSKTINGKDDDILFSLESKSRDGKFNTDLNTAKKLLKIGQTNGNSVSNSDFSTDIEPLLSNTGFTNYGNEDQGNSDSWFSDEKSNNDETFFSLPERSDNDKDDTERVMGKAAFPVVNKYDGGFDSSQQSLPESSYGFQQSLPESSLGFNDYGFSDDGWNDGFDYNTGFENDPVSIDGGTLYPTASEGHFVSDNTHCEDIETRTCITSSDCQCYGLFYCDKANAQCKKYGSTVPEGLPSSEEFSDLPEIESDWTGWIDS